MFNIEDMKEEIARALQGRGDHERLREMSQFLEEKRSSGIAQRKEYTFSRIGMSPTPFGQSRTQNAASKRVG